jgi:hypothetical protein
VYRRRYYHSTDVLHRLYCIVLGSENYTHTDEGWGMWVDEWPCGCYFAFDGSDPSAGSCDKHRSLPGA